MKRLVKVLSIAMAAVLCVSVAGCGGKDDSKLTKVKVCEVTHSLFYAPQYAAISEGFFEEEGLEIELTNGGGSDKVMAAVLTGDMDIGLGGPEASIYVYKEGRSNSPKMFAQLTKRDGSLLISKNPVENFSWDDLKGKTVIPGRKGGVPYMTLEYVIKQNGLDPANDMTLDDSIQFDLMAGAFTSGTADYVTLFEPTASMIIQEGKGYLATSIGAESGEIPYTGYFSNQDYINSNPDIIQKFTNAIAKGQKWVAEHSAAEIAESIVEQFPDSDMDTLTAAVQSYKDIDAWNATPVMTEEAFNRLQDVIIEAGELDAKVDFSAVIDTSFAEKAVQ